MRETRKWLSLPHDATAEQTSGITQRSEGQVAAHTTHRW